MTKATVIIGENESGKTLTAKLLTKIYKKEEVVWLTGRNFKNQNFFFNQCTLDTKCVVIDDVRTTEYIGSLIMLVHGIEVEKQLLAPFEINPKIIIIYDQGFSKNELEDISPSISRRIEIIECKKENLEKLIQSLK